MNTIFKLYLEMRPLLACASTLFGWDAFRRMDDRRRSVSAVVLSVWVAGGLFTSVTGVVGLLREPRVPSPRPTFDGMAYLDSQNPLSDRPSSG